ncbi:FecR family protein [Flavitalea sp.]|nr:FecR domain-containing protein [Flavitalea sp.]
MEGKEQFDDLLISYLLNELDEIDEALVEEWVSASENNRLQLLKLKQILSLVRLGDIADKINEDQEWKLFERGRQCKEQVPAASDEAEGYGNGVIKVVQLKRKTSIYKAIAMAAVAACIVLVFVLGWSLLGNEKPVAHAVSINNNESHVVIAPVLRQLTNNTNILKEFLLNDGTKVLLSGNSKLSYYEPFQENKRDVHLSGKGEFIVAKNESSPFTVFSGDISTTALGTRFIVTAFEDSHDVTVKLYEGKVVVKRLGGKGQTNKKDQSNNRDYYLVPGDQLVYSKPSGAVRVSVFITKMPVKADSIFSSVPMPMPVTEDPAIPKYGSASWFMFNNQPLSDVFDQLANMYNARITYSKDDVSRMYFIGTFNKSDSLEKVLKQIIKINNLKLTKQHNEYLITKE